MDDHNLELRQRIRLLKLVIILLTIIVGSLVIVLILPTPSPTHQESFAPETKTTVAHVPLVEQQPQPSHQHFLSTFDGSLAVARSWQPNDWDIAVHARDGIDHAWKALPPMMADHGADCSAPPATHQVATYEDAVFICKDHVMTAINAGGYGVIYLTPNNMVDFSQNEAIIRFDVSTLRTSSRDWIDLWISPYEDNLALPLQDQLPDLQGEPRNAVHIRMEGGIDQTMFKAMLVRNFQSQEVQNTWQGTYQDVLQPDAKRRDTFELRISRTHIAFGMPKYNLWWIDSDIEDLGWDMGVVQFGHHTYTPTKDCSNCSPNTWHWDNISINPAHPFTIIRCQQRMVDQDSNPTVGCSRPAPPNSHLRFAAFGNHIEVSFDKGASWQLAEKQVQEENNQYQSYSYWTVVPAGVTDIQLRGQGILNYGWHAQDFALWSLNTTPERP